MQGMGSLVKKGMALSTKKGDPRLSRKYKEVRLKKLAMDGWVCYYCGYEGKDMTIDHVIPVSKAPELAIDINNMVSACKPCNSRKNKKSQGRFLEEMRTNYNGPKVATIPPQRSRKYPRTILF